MDHYNKITGFLSWLKTEQGRPDDIVAMVDAYVQGSNQCDVFADVVNECIH